jgi:hypothetical protein
LNAQALRSERKDLEVYQSAIDTSNGMGLDRYKEEIAESFVTYVGKKLVHEGTKEVLPITYNYEKWLSGYSVCS